jgi:hypothetical protein
LSIRCTGKTDPWPEGAFAVPYLRSLDFNFYPSVPLFRRLSIPSGASSSLASRTEVECEAILPGSFEHHHNLSELRSAYIQRRVDYWRKAGGPNGEVEGKGDPDLEVRRLPFQFTEKLRHAEIRECADTFGKGLYPSRISQVLDRSRSLRTLVIDSYQLTTMKLSTSPFPDATALLVSPRNMIASRVWPFRLSSWRHPTMGARTVRSSPPCKCFAIEQWPDPDHKKFGSSPTPAFRPHDPEGGGGSRWRSWFCGLR